MHHFSALAGGFALGLMMIPITLRSTEAFLRAVPQFAARRRMALGASKWKNHRSRSSCPRPSAASSPACPGPRARRRRNRAAALHGFGNQFWSPRLGSAHRLPARHDFHLCHRALRRLASPGLGRGSGPAGLVLVANIVARWYSVRGASQFRGANHARYGSHARVCKHERNQTASTDRRPRHREAAPVMRKLTDRQPQFLLRH